MSKQFEDFTLRDLARVIRLNLKAAIRNNRVPQPVLMLGAPGSGKTQFSTRRDTPNSLPNIYAEVLSEIKGIEITADQIAIVVEKPARRDAAQMAGYALPVEQDDGTVQTQNTVAPTIVDLRNEMKRLDTEYSILVLDEAAAAAIPEQKVLSDCFDPNEHSLGGTRLPEGCIVVGTGNRAHDKAGSMKILSQNISRALCANILRDTAAWAEDFCIPHGINPMVVECALAHDSDGRFIADAVPVEQVSYNTYRGMVAASYHLDEFMASPEFVGVIPQWVERTLAMNMGADAAKVLCDWIAQRDEVPTGEEIISDPENARVPDQTGFQMLAANLAFAEVKDVRTATAALHYLVRLRKDLQISLGVKLMSITTDKDWMITDPLATAFVTEFHEFLPIAQESTNL